MDVAKKTLFNSDSSCDGGRYDDGGFRRGRGTDAMGL